MEEPNEEHAVSAKPADDNLRKTSLLKTIISLVLFIGLYYWVFKSWTSVLLFVTVIFLHESGHFIAMKCFGYTSVNMMFVPFVGAYVSGQATNISRGKKLIVLLAGPLPGIVIGTVCFALYTATLEPIYLKIAWPFLLLNLFNMLPIFPLDGGQFFQVLLFNGSRIIQLGFLYLSMAVLLYLFVKFDYSWMYLLVALLVFLRIRQYNLIHRIRRQLDEDDIDYACSYDDLTDEEYWHIRNVAIDKSRMLSRKYSTDEQADDEQDLVKIIENVLVPGYPDELAVAAKIGFTLVWAAALIIPTLMIVLNSGVANFIWSYY